MSRGSKQSGANAARGLMPAGLFLYGAFGAADAMYAPVVWRFHTYTVEVNAVARAYMRTLMALPAWHEWRDAARREPWVLPHDEVDWPEINGRNSFAAMVKFQKTVCPELELAANRVQTLPGKGWSGLLVSMARRNHGGGA